MNYSYRRILSFFWQFTSPYWYRFLFGSLCAIISSGAALYQAYAVALIVNIITTYKLDESFDSIKNILIIWFLTIVIRNIMGFTSKYINRNLAEKAAVNAEIFAINHLALLDMSWHEKENTGNKLKRIYRGARGLVDITALWTGDIIEMVIIFLGAILIISRFDTTLTIYIVLYQIIYYFVASTGRRKGVKAMQAANLKDEEISGLWHEIVANIRSVKVLGMANKILDYAKIKTFNYLKDVDRRIFWFQGSGYAQGLWEGFVRIILVSYVIWGILQGSYEVGFLVLFYGYFNSLTNAVNKFTTAAQEIATVKVNIGRLTDLLDELITIDKTRGKLKFPKVWNKISIKNLSFSYGETSVLSNINLEIKKGEKIGIVGLSGAGKSTLFKLLLKEHESYEGEILVGDKSLKKILKSSYVEHMAAVLQETEVFNMSLKQNITMVSGADENNTELFERAISISHVGDFLSKLPQGVETLIGEKGVKLSGGEKQRLGIARAVFKNPQILFLDEATSHLDVESEQKIQDSLKKFFKKVTAVVIAHRLSTIREMDRIVVIEGGKIIESGTFDELSNQNSRFKEFWDKQKM